MSRSNSAQTAAMPGKRLADLHRIEVGQVEIDVRVPGLFHLADDGQADHVARGQLAAGIVVGHETVSVAVDQPGPFAPHGLADQAAAAAGDVQHRGMELHELHVAQLGAGAIGHGHAVAGGPVGIGRLAIELPGPAGGQNRLLGPDQGFAVLRVPDQRPAAGAVVGQQVEREGVFPDVDVGGILGTMDDRPHDLLARGVAQGVGDAVAAVSALAAQGQAVALPVELRAPADQLARCAGRLADDLLDHLPIAERCRRRASVSATWSSKRSSGSSTAAMPPWA